MTLSTKLFTAGGFFAFFVFGFMDNLKGPLLPEMRSGRGPLDLNYGQVGTVFLAGYLGFMLATLLSGFLASVIGNRGVLQLAGICLLAGSLGFGWANSYPVWVASMAVVGIGLGAIELGANALMVELHSDSRGLYLNLLATFHGVGSFIVPLAAAKLITDGYSWTQVYAFSALLAIPLMLLFRSRRPQRNRNHPVAGSHPTATCTDWSTEFRQLIRIGFTLQMCWFYLLLTAYVALELGLAAWMIEYLQKFRHMSVELSSSYLSGFFVLLTLGRLSGAFVVHSFGYLRSVCVALIGSTLCLVVAIWGPPSCVWCFPLSGLFMSIVFPTVTAAVSDIHKQNMGALLGLLFAFSGLGGAIGPWAIGQVSQWAGLESGIGVTVGFGLVALMALRHCKTISYPISISESGTP
jgi:MFS transporter, FHS family, glucose/mannose:H+ symporter